MSALEDRLRRFAYEWHEAMNSPYAVNMMPLLLEVASDVRSLAASSLEAENAKLRELCKELAEFLTEAEWLQWPELRAEMQRLELRG